MAHPKKLKALLGDTKTDANDALNLAIVLRLGSFPAVYVPSLEVESLRTLVRLRGDVVEKLKRTKQQVRTLLVKNHLQHLATRYDDIFGVQALRWLKEEVHLADPWHQRQLVMLLEEGAFYNRQQYELSTELAKVAVHRKEVEILQSLPGFDYTLALTAIAEIGDIKRFPNRKKFAAYCGLVPKNHQSGDKDPQHTRRRHGNSQLTYVFEMAAQVNQCMRKGRFFFLFQRLSKKIGVQKALTAVAHHLCFVAHGILRKGALYEETHAALYAEKRRRLSKRAKELVSPATLSSVIDRLLAQQGLKGVPT